IRSILISIGIGSLAAALLLFVIEFTRAVPSESLAYKRSVAPVAEEILKAVFLVYLVRSRRVGFVVDAAIQGFALGAGFALFENIYYLESLNETNLLVWIVRGFGTAVMHGGTTAIAGIVSKSVSDIKDSLSLLVFVPGLLAAIVIHATFNLVLLPPVTSTVLVVVLLPMLMFGAFAQSEKATRSWLGVGFDNDAELLTMVTTGGIAKTRIGQYLDSIQSKFRGEVVADMLCYLRLYLELAIQAKGILLMRESGFNIDPDPKVRAKFDEMAYLQRSIGKTGLLALSPFLRTSSRDLWQMHMLKSR
ncbi:MAG TPA: PrsW family glutamic-type intramembrane protease, partial [Bacteroidota bacterium]